MPLAAVALEPEMTEPPSGAELLERLRGDLADRPVVDLELAGGLREWLEDGISAAVAGRSETSPPIVVDKQRLHEALGGERARATTTPMALGAMVDALFRQLVTTGGLDDPWTDALAALGADDRGAPVVDHVAGLPADELAELRADLAEQTAALAVRWPPLAPHWLARTQEALSAPLAGGRVVLRGVVDLAVGGPSDGRSTVCLVEVKSGRRRIEHRADLHYYALLETLRAGAPPFRVATYYTRTGELDVEDVDHEVLANAVRRTLDAVSVLAAGDEESA
ncbi:MAG TPA: hypothetical protein VK277_14095 [Acidimicrobiales bacterium]|nr:hypothetical protein [Acidimicrobiales bacterium]